MDTFIHNASTYTLAYIPFCFQWIILILLTNSVSQERNLHCQQFCLALLKWLVKLNPPIVIKQANIAFWKSASSW